MAHVTSKGGVRSYQREAILVVADSLHRDLPALDRVALLTSPPELSPVNVGVAVGAIAAYVAEDQTHVALLARNLSVHSPQGIARLAVVEFNDAAQRLPGAEGVAVFAGDIQVAMRAARGRSLAGLLGAREPSWQQEDTHQRRSAQLRAHGRPCLEV